jgi:predicted helicase
MMDHNLVPGTFGYIEALIRREAKTEYDLGVAFEWICKWYLENAPIYRGKFQKVWRFMDWPDRWGSDNGVDLIALTHDGQIWAIQAKACHNGRTITKREIDSFLSESNRPQVAYRLLMGTTDNIGANARRVIQQQEKQVGQLLRGHFLEAEVRWPTEIYAISHQLPKNQPRPHQENAIRAVVKGFEQNDRGQLIMACGTGKTLTALWISEKLESSLTLVLVPSLSLVGQNLREWGRNATLDFDSLVVCSDESVSRVRVDHAIHSVSELGVTVTTNPTLIRNFLLQDRKRPAVVFATYQSSDQISLAQIGDVRPFELVICDEAHRLTGGTEGLFATVLDEKKIRSRRRLFMTATPRFFNEAAKQKASGCNFSIASMDDKRMFGPEFHCLTFHDAITADPPLLTDYRAVVIGVTHREATSWLNEGKFVKTLDGASTDARSLAAQMGLIKAINKYKLRRVITFHSSVAKAKRFVDDTRTDSLPQIISCLSSSTRLSGEIWAKHISGETPAGKRATILKGLGDLPQGTIGVLSNCACLGEGVDVPALDGIAFIDPKNSMVDIIQAVGRVIRLSEGKRFGTIVIPVFVDDSQDSEVVLSHSSFATVWQVLKALRAHDRRLADELDQLRFSLGEKSMDLGEYDEHPSRGSVSVDPNNVNEYRSQLLQTDDCLSGCGVRLFEKIHLDIPSLSIADFERAFYVRAVQSTTMRFELTVDQILDWADDYKRSTGTWPTITTGQIDGTNHTWGRIDRALRQGSYGLRERITLARLLEVKRGVNDAPRAKPVKNLPPLSLKQILSWADAYFEKHGTWPDSTSGPIDGTNENWKYIEHWLNYGTRGFAGGYSLVSLLRHERGVITKRVPSKLNINRLLRWVANYRSEHGGWPTSDSGVIPGTGETWKEVDTALKNGLRGLPRGSSLPSLIATSLDKICRLQGSASLSWKV